MLPRACCTSAGGRNQEVPSEDPLVNGNFGAAYTAGVQTGEDARYLKTAVTLKHAFAYSLCVVRSHRCADTSA